MDKSPYLAQAIQQIGQPMAPIQPWGPDAGQLQAMAAAVNARRVGQPPPPGAPGTPGAPQQQIGDYLDRYAMGARPPGAPLQGLLGIGGGQVAAPG